MTRRKCSHGRVISFRKRAASSVQEIFGRTPWADEKRRALVAYRLTERSTRSTPRIAR